MSRQRGRALGFGMIAVVMLPALLSAGGMDDAHWKQADQAVRRGIDYLRSTQNEDGSWTPQPGPAVTAMVLRVMLDRPDIDVDDPAVRKGLAFVMSKVKPDGGIHDGILENYNTAICLSMLPRVIEQPGVAAAITKAQDYLRSLQWHHQPDPRGAKVDQNHPFFGGAGYGRSGRPDLSNTQIMLEGLHDSGLDCKDPAYIRAMVFITRCQGIDANDLLKDKIVLDGGFIYSTSISKDLIGVPESKASPQMMDEAKTGAPVSGLRTYGSMTYAGFKSYLYAELPRDDARVQAAWNWIRRNYTLDRNPGLPEATQLQGLYYYLMTFARALSAWGQPVVTSTDGKEHQWANDLAAKLASLQRSDGSWLNEADRWMEGDPNLVTAYALIALSHGMK